jgi:hypothetical protein
MQKFSLVGTAPFLMLSACASSLSINDASQNPVVGVPFRVSQIFVKTGEFAKHTKGIEPCAPSHFVEEVSLPTGALFYANVKPAQFAKTGFVLKVNENGGLAEIALNTEPSAVEATKNVAELVKSVLPVLGITAEKGLAQAAGRVPCDTSPNPASIKYVPIEDYLRAR